MNQKRATILCLLALVSFSFMTLHADEQKETFTNSLGMRFREIGIPGVRFSIWETRLGDFRTFAEETRHDAKEAVDSLQQGNWGKHQHYWSQPGFTQTEQHPVCGVNYYDAVTFCDWLTKKEQKTGLISTNQHYRLPTHEEWDKAVDMEKQAAAKETPDTWIFTWGSAFPPPPSAGNYLDETAKTEHWPQATMPVIEGYDDGYARTAPVGSFPANHHGLFDLEGNVWEWCLDESENELPKKLLRGASWFDEMPKYIQPLERVEHAKEGRRIDVGFRCVLETL